MSSAAFHVSQHLCTKLHSQLCLCNDFESFRFSTSLLLEKQTHTEPFYFLSELERLLSWGLPPLPTLPSSGVQVLQSVHLFTSTVLTSVFVKQFQLNFFFKCSLTPKCLWFLQGSLALGFCDASQCKFVLHTFPCCVHIILQKYMCPQLTFPKLWPTSVILILKLQVCKTFVESTFAVGVEGCLLILLQWRTLYYLGSGIVFALSIQNHKDDHKV